MATDCGYLHEALKDRSLNDYLLALYQKRRECCVFVWFQIIDIWVPHTTYIWKEESHSNKGSKLTINQTIIDPLYSLIEISPSFSGKKIAFKSIPSQILIASLSPAHTARGHHLMDNWS